MPLGRSTSSTWDGGEQLRIITSGCVFGCDCENQALARGGDLRDHVISSVHAVPAARRVVRRRLVRLLMS